MSKKILLLSTLLFAARCTTPGMIMKSWVGHTENELYKYWGQPSKITDNGSDGKIVMYVPGINEEGAKSKYVSATQPVEYITPGNNEYKKTKLFYITPMGNIFAWKMK